jgi:hypothetical protein
VAVWKGDGEMIELGDDSVAGYQPPSAVLEAIRWARVDDQEGIAAAFLGVTA